MAPVVLPEQLDYIGCLKRLLYRHQLFALYRERAVKAHRQVAPAFFEKPFQVGDHPDGG